MSDTNKNELLNKLKIEDDDSDTSGRGQYLRYYAVAAAVMVVVLIIVLLYRPAEQSDLVPAPSTQVKTYVPSVEAAPEAQIVGGASDEAILNASGYITARLMATVSAEVMGRILSVEVEEGMEVERNQVLARLDNALAKVDWELSRANIDAAEARITSLKTELEEARRVLARLLSLDEGSFASEAQITRARADVDKLTADIRAVNADLRVSRLAAQRQKEVLDDHTIRAPFSGVVTEKNAQAGEIVAPSSAGGGFTRTGICTIVDMGSLEIEVDVNEAYIGRVFDGQKVIAQLDAYPDWDIPAAVIAVVPTADRSKATVRVRIKILTDDSRILPDMGVKVAFYKDSVTEENN